MRRLRVLHLFNTLQPSGMEKRLVSAEPYFRELGIESVAVGRGADRPFAEEMEKAGIPVAVFGSFRFWTAEGKKFAKYVKALGPDIVDIHPEGDWLLTVLSVRRAAGKGVPLVRTIHNLFEPTGIDRWKRRIQSFLADRFVSQFIAVGPHLRHHEKNYNRDAVFLLNWVGDSFRPEPDKRLNAVKDKSVALVGNCSEIKNHELVLKAAIEAGWGVFHVGSEANATYEEKDLLEQLDDQGQLLARGVTDPKKYLMQSDLFAMPSLKEGFGVALAEALQLGVPAVISDVPSFSWTEGITGITRLPLDVNSWVEFLKESDQIQREVDLRNMDLSARRGAQDYANVYRKVAVREL